jgi:hypothetical protein
VRPLALEEARDGGRVAAVGAEQSVFTDQPQIAGACDRHRGRCDVVLVRVADQSARVLFGGRFRLLDGVEQAFDLGGREAGQVQIEAGVGQFGELQRQHRLVPAGIEREPVVGDHVGALLRRRQVRKLDHRHLGEPQLACGQQPAVTGDHTVLAIDQDRVGPAELGDAGGDARDLLVAVRARIAGVGDQRLDLAVRDGERVQNRCLGNEEARRRRTVGGLGVSGRRSRAGGLQTANPANLGLHPDAIEAPRSRPPHGFSARKDPSRSAGRIAKAETTKTTDRSVAFAHASLARLAKS